MIAMRILRAIALAGGSAVSFAGAATAECTRSDSPIETDRPDVTNSSTVVPVGSLQIENGIDSSRDHGADIVNGTNGRWRLGVAPCLEVLVDVPTYVAHIARRRPVRF
jgi:hypothetical protein